METARPGMPALILASASPRRRHLLASLGVAFDVVVADVDELDDPVADPSALVLHNARMKCEAVSAEHPGRPILAADTTVCVDRVVLNKPVDLEDARRMLRLLSGRTHQVHTAVVLHHPDLPELLTRRVTSEVEFLPLDSATIDAYLGEAQVLDKAGAYGIQEHSGRIVRLFRGSLTNIVGLPLEETRELLRAAGLLPDLT